MVEFDDYAILILFFFIKEKRNRKLYTVSLIGLVVGVPKDKGSKEFLGLVGI